MTKHELEGGRQVLTNVHNPSSCTGRVCAIHSMSNHAMRHFPQNFRDDTGVMERMCPHGVGHPDPDHMVWARSVGQDWQGTHGCDGCCQIRKTYILLDMDGVINAFGSYDPKLETGWMGEWRYEKINGYWIRWSTELIDTLNHMQSLDNVEIVILSTWRKEAVSMLFPVFGMTELDYHVLDPDSLGVGYEGGWGGYSKWWKLDEMKDFLYGNPDADVIWIDDDIRYDYATKLFLEEDAPERLTIICPATHLGLRKVDTDAILDRIMKNNSGGFDNA